MRIFSSAVASARKRAICCNRIRDASRPGSFYISASKLPIRPYSTGSHRLEDVLAVLNHETYAYRSDLDEGDVYLAVLPKPFHGTALYDFITSAGRRTTESGVGSIEGATAKASFLIREADGNEGLGMFSLDNISCGDVIVSEQPVLLAALTRRPSLGLNKHLPQTLATLCRRHLNSSILDRVLSLSRASTSLSIRSEREGEDDLVRVLATNATRVDADMGGEDGPDSFAALLLQTSRCNHSCSPNSLINFHPDTCTLSLTAFSHISASSEITLSYIDATLPRTERRAQLREKWAFNCDCPSCSLPPSESSASDIRRTEIRNWLNQPSNKAAAIIPLRRPSSASESSESHAKLIHSTIIPSVQRYVGLCDAEGSLHTDYLYPALERGAFAFALLGQRDEFLAWATRAREQLKVLNLAPSARRANFSVEQWTAAIANPEESIPRWGEVRS